MECKYIITGVEDYSEDRKNRESFFVVTFAQAESFELQQEFASLSFDPADADFYFNELLKNPDIYEYALLISMDGKRGRFRRINGDQLVLEGELEQLVPFFSQGDHIGVVGSYEKFLNCLYVELERNPEKAIQYQYVPDPSTWNIPKRFDFRWMPEDFGPGTLDSEISDAARNPEAGSDDAIALIYIARDLELNWLERDPYQIEDEVKMRLAKKISFKSHFLSFSELTMEELNQRSLRAKWYLKKFQEAVAHLGYDEERHLKAMRFLRGLDNDVLAELSVVAFYTSFEMKPVAIVLSERFREPHQF